MGVLYLNFQRFLFLGGRALSGLDRSTVSLYHSFYLRSSCEPFLMTEQDGTCSSAAFPFPLLSSSQGCLISERIEGPLGESVPIAFAQTVGVMIVLGYLLPVLFAILSVQMHLRKKGAHKAAKFIYIDGGIGAGKSTLIKTIQAEVMRRGYRVLACPEPVDEWQTVSSGEKSLFQNFYENPNEFAFPFQVLVCLTRLRQQRDAEHAIAKGHVDVAVIERSIVSEQVFRRSLSEHFTDLQTSVLSTLDATAIPPASLVVYLRTTPECCFGRISQRARTGEDGIQMEYLSRLHTEHERAFNTSANVILDGDADVGVHGKWAADILARAGLCKSV